MKAKHTIKSTRLAPLAGKLRGEFEQLLSTAEAVEERFCWDPWYVRGQYNLLRSPSHFVFSEDKQQELEATLSAFAAENLGCPELSPIWLSLYTHGHFQKLHADFPHGPWAFVYSLSPKKRSFRGGQTQLANPSLLRFWSLLDDQKDHHETEFFSSFDLKQGELLFFDSRLPHKVEEVIGPSDPLDGRLVLHGWLPCPPPWVEGKVDPKRVNECLESFLASIGNLLEKEASLHGFLCLRFRVNQKGRVSSFERLPHTLIDRADPSRNLGRVLKAFEQALEKITFPSEQSVWHFPLMMRS